MQKFFQKQSPNVVPFFSASAKRSRCATYAKLSLLRRNLQEFQKNSPHGASLFHCSLIFQRAKLSVRVPETASSFLPGCPGFLFPAVIFRVWPVCIFVVFFDLFTYKLYIIYNFDIKGLLLKNIII